jgi:orotidine-5'-phosphate decarboxylase
VSEMSKNPLVIALDVDSAGKALALVERLRGLAGMFKIGSQLFTAEGPEIVRKITGLGEQVFLDLKFHDIPNTVARAAVAAARMGVAIFNVHASGGSAMMRATSEALDEAAAREGWQRPLVLGVTVLTSMNDEALVELGLGGTAETQVIRLAKLSANSGLNGVVASPHEIRSVRDTVDKPGFVILTPGIRPDGSKQADDQSRVMTAGEAIRAGADFIVVGRPITGAADAAQAARRLLEEVEQAGSPDV